MSSSSIFYYHGTSYQITPQDVEEMQPDKHYVMSEYKKMKPTYDFNKYEYIDTWAVYISLSTQESGVIWTQLDDYILNAFNYLEESDRHPMQCSHHLFTTKSEFFDKFSAAICHTGGYDSSHQRKEKLLTFQKIIRGVAYNTPHNNKPSNPQTSDESTTFGVNIDKIDGKFGLCNECRILFVLKHNGFKKWLKYHYKLLIKSPLYRCFGLMLFSQCICNQPIILKSILANEDCYSIIFNMFFNMIKTMQFTETMKFINDNVVRFFTDKNFRAISMTSCDFDYEYYVNNMQIEALLRYEKNISTVLSVIKPLSIYFHLKHIRLFIKLGFPNVFHNFFANFSQSPHLKEHCGKLLRNFTLSVASEDELRAGCFRYNTLLFEESQLIYQFHPILIHIKHLCELIANKIVIYIEKLSP